MLQPGLTLPPAGVIQKGLKAGILLGKTTTERAAGHVQRFRNRILINALMAHAIQYFAAHTVRDLFAFPAHGDEAMQLRQALRCVSPGLMRVRSIKNPGRKGDHILLCFHQRINTAPVPQRAGALTGLMLELQGSDRGRGTDEPRANA